MEKLEFEKLPTTNKNSYIKDYQTELRCINGKFLSPGNVIDESSGSTGISYNWVRGKKERIRIHKVISRACSQTITPYSNI